MYSLNFAGLAEPLDPNRSAHQKDTELRMRLKILYKKLTDKPKKMATVS